MVSIVSDARFALRGALFAAYTAGTLGRHELIAKNFSEAEDNRVVLETMLRYGRHMSRLFGLRVKTAGLGPLGHLPGGEAVGRGRIFVMNHRSGLDIVVCLAHVQGRLVSRADLAGWPVIGKIARRAGILFVDRENRRSAAQVVHQMIDSVEHGRGITIFPEGTTYSGDEVRPFKPGAFAVARRTDCEVVPLGIAYAGTAFSFGDESFTEHMRRVACQGRVDAALVAGEPLRCSDGDPAALSDRAHAAVQGLVHEARGMLVGD
mgnify:CR=1 FL=1